jgi:hypothetical protein
LSDGIIQLNLRPVMEACIMGHTYNPSYSGVEDGRDAQVGGSRLEASSRQKNRKLSEKQTENKRTGHIAQVIE